ncbi:MAG: hypothetical protein R3B70_28475 [Polyangiaceae bacterium]
MVTLTAVLTGGCAELIGTDWSEYAETDGPATSMDIPGGSGGSGGENGSGSGGGGGAASSIGGAGGVGATGGGAGGDVAGPAGCRTSADCGPTIGTLDVECLPPNDDCIEPGCTSKSCSANWNCPASFECGGLHQCIRKRCTSDVDCDGFCLFGACYDTLGDCITSPKWPPLDFEDLGSGG